MRFHRATLLLALAAACSDTTGPALSDALYTGNLARWNSTGPASYQMVLTRSCACTTGLEAVTIVVRNKTVESRTFVDSGLAVPGARVNDFPDVPGLFALIDRARGGGAVSYAAQYEGTYGYPIGLTINWVGGTITDDVSYAVSEFTSLPQP